MPRRIDQQRIGTAGERLVASITDEHESWLGRLQELDFGIDLEAELALPEGTGQSLAGSASLPI